MVKGYLTPRQVKVLENKDEGKDMIVYLEKCFSRNHVDDPFIDAYMTIAKNMQFLYENESQLNESARRGLKMKVFLAVGDILAYLGVLDAEEELLGLDCIKA